MKNFLFIFSGCLFCLFLSYTVSGATWTVTTATDENNLCPGGSSLSLREAIKCANNGDFIQFAPSLDGVPILLSMGEIYIYKNLTISGRGESNTIVDGQHGQRIFIIYHEKTVVMEELTVRNGKTDGSGAGILNSGNLTLKYVTMSGHKIKSDGDGSGCAIYSNPNSNVTIISCSIVDNEIDVVYAARGGVIYSANCNTTIKKSTFENNRCKSDMFAGGAFLAGYAGIITIDSCLIARNKSTSLTGDCRGGAIYYSQGQLNITNSTLEENEAYGLAPDGGAIYVHTGAQIHIKWSTLTQNHVNSTTYSADGGALSAFGGSVVINACTIEGNTAYSPQQSSGAGVYIQSTNCQINSSTIANNVCSGPPGSFGLGAGIQRYGGYLDMRNSILWNNTAQYAPEYYYSSGSHSIQYSVIKGMYPGGIGNLDGSLASNDPLLVPLSDNGGWSETMAIDCNSAAFNAADPSNSDPDQRGVPMKFTRKDMGAFENNSADNDLDEHPIPCDCDDNNPTTHPDAPEICGNGEDDDCNGGVDDFDPAGYCCGYGGGGDYYINRLTAPMNGVDCISGDNGGYGDYMYEVLNINPYAPYMYLILYPGGYPGMQHWQIYADWNKDNAFTPAEKIVDYCTSIPCAMFVPVPPGFSGDTRMRVIMKKVDYSCSPGDIDPNACGDIQMGEVEDYTIMKTPFFYSQVPDIDQVWVFPNPFSDYLLIQTPDAWDEAMLFELYNAQGQKVLSRTEQPSSMAVRLDVSELVPGTYFMVMRTGEMVETSMVVKQ